MHMVFVYGTLKRGFPNYDGWMTACRFAGRFRTRDCFPLVVGGKWYSPIMIGEAGIGHKVLGEVFEVDDQGLAALDKIEGIHLANGYDRISVKVESLDAGGSIEAWTYVKDRAVIDAIHEELCGEYTLDPRYLPASQR